MSPHHLFEVGELLLYPLLLLAHGTVTLAIVCQDASLQVVGLVYLAFVTVHGEIVVGSHIGHIVEVAAHHRQA